MKLNLLILHNVAKSKFKTIKTYEE